MSSQLPDIITTAWISSPIILGILWITFVILFAIEWRQRIRDNHDHEEKMKQIIFDYEHRLVKVEKDVENEGDWTKMLIQDSNLISQEIKDSIISDIVSGKGRVKMPNEENT